MTFCRAQSTGHSAHVGQELEIHYRWHALYGRRVRRFYGERRSGTDVLVVEGEPGAAIVVAAWMFDPAACASMQIGAPHVSTEALGDLDRLLMEHGLRRSFPDDADVVEEDRHEERAKADRRVQAATPALHDVGFVGAKGAQVSRTQYGDLSVGAPPDGSRRRDDRGERQ